MWEFPGGKIDEGESPVEALIRELREELGIEVAVGHAMRPVVWNDGTVSIRLMPYRCRIESGEPVPAEHEEIRWCPRHLAETLRWAPADLPVLAELNGMAEESAD